ncbi:MAG: Cytochrome c oxidase subunit 6 [Ramalina farinacea]|uniref:Cytochrome c oxidase subunit 6, mitochondrial n=1 Tax=Ramalina farinacea TaxID=258253 RepID=A0AA43QJF9_9LECA|nr:Cytochrome c oxidase subunit 6 [Ramalina farinacea]
MSVLTLLRTASRSTSSCLLRNSHPSSPSPWHQRGLANTSTLAIRSRAFTSTAKRQADTAQAEVSSSAHHEESFEEFTARYEKEFDGVQDVFELQRNLNNAFAYDLVPSPSVIIAALRAARRVNDYPTAVRIFEGIKAKVENRGQYHEYLRDLESLREELGVDLKEDLYPEQIYTAGANTH